MNTLKLNITLLFLFFFLAPKFGLGQPPVCGYQVTNGGNYPIDVVFWNDTACAVTCQTIPANTSYIFSCGACSPLTDTIVTVNSKNSTALSGCNGFVQQSSRTDNRIARKKWKKQLAK